MRKLTASVVCASLLICSGGCGTILHPERKGQISGQIDPAVAILNGVGLVMFLIPGVIAFAVDFSNGTIYLPSGQTASADIELDEMAPLSVGAANLSRDQIQSVLDQHTSGAISLDQDMEIYEALADGGWQRLSQQNVAVALDHRQERLWIAQR